jgi:hypothetical protein
MDPSLQRWVFRDGKRSRAGETLRAELWQCLLQLRNADPPSSELLTESLLRAGELECSITDAAMPDPHYRQLALWLTQLTDALADALVSARCKPLCFDAFAPLLSLAIPEHLECSPPEGFCFYALHPIDFANFPVSSRLPACVIGIRSIGTTLSAVLAARFKNTGAWTRRFTVRPTGHPYERELAFTSDQIRIVAEADSRGAEFFIADEGPGLSGSSFLSVGEALADAGIARNRIAFIGSVEPHMEKLVAPHAAARWRSFNWYRIPSIERPPEEAKICLSAGGWRDRVFAGTNDWPGVWTQLEPQKFLSASGDEFYKFIGHGHYGQSVRGRYEHLANAGFGPTVRSVENGFATFPVITGRFCRKSDISRATIYRLASYCAFRAREMGSMCCEPKLRESVRFNLAQELGTDCGLTLETVKLVIPDANMFPYEWIATEDGTILKLDGAMHGENHFFPGPVDIAWDLAATIVEWEMSPEAAATFLDAYASLSKDAAQGRIHDYLLAYLAFRTSYLAMAAAAMAGTPEEPRLRRDLQKYREKLSSQRSMYCAA